MRCSPFRASVLTLTVAALLLAPAEAGAQSQQSERFGFTKLPPTSAHARAGHTCCIPSGCGPSPATAVTYPRACAEGRLRARPTRSSFLGELRRPGKGCGRSCATPASSGAAAGSDPCPRPHIHGANAPHHRPCSLQGQAPPPGEDRLPGAHRRRQAQIAHSRGPLLRPGAAGAADVGRHLRIRLRSGSVPTAPTGPTGRVGARSACTARTSPSWSRAGYRTAASACATRRCCASTWLMSVGTPVVIL